LTGVEHRLAVASAQVKSAVLLAGLYAEGETTVVEPVTTRNHTETMLEAMGAPISIQFAAATVKVRKAQALKPLDLTVPGDLSAAVFWLVVAGLHPAARVTLPGVGLNPSRTQVLDVLQESIGIRVHESHHRSEGGETVADLEVGTAREPRAFELRAPWTAWLIDELPALAVAATQLRGRSRIVEARELRVKESDRIATMAAGLRAMGARVRELDDGWEIDGPTRLQGARVSSGGDHRVAMALAVAGLSEGGVGRVILTRPAVEAGERLGFLPGDMLAKVDPYLRPLYDALYDMLDPERLAGYMERGTIEVAPLAFMRGRTLNDSFIVLDEAQNTTPEQMQMFLTRLGFGSKMVVTGDITQIDLPREQASGLIQVREILGDIDGISFVEFGNEDVVRHKLVQRIVEAYRRHAEETGTARRR
jgi:phosphate starvation-inducible PhoH-like protein